MQPLLYIFSASVCLSLFYLVYRQIFKKDTHFVHARAYLLISMVMSLLLPLSNYRINPAFLTRDKVAVSVTPQTSASGSFSYTVQESTAKVDWNKITDQAITVAVALYLVIATILLARIITQIIILTVQYHKSHKIHRPDCVLLYNHRFRSTFSFFRWIFVYENGIADDETEQIIAHERIHVSQYHSIDLIWIELLTAVMWFNPMVWMMKNTLQLVHEYLADEGALGTGIDKLRYQALLINQVSEERLIGLSSSFNHSLIKKRMIMMTKSKITRKTNFRLLALLPVGISLLFAVAVFNGISNENATAAGSGPEAIILQYPASTVFPDNAPPDTIIKKTIIKKINKNNPQDTIVEESEEIITGEDAIRERETIRHEGGGRTQMVIVHSDDDKDIIRHERDGERREHRVIINENGDDVRHEGRGEGRRVTVHVMDGEEISEEEITSGDSVKIVKIITRGGNDNVNVHSVDKNFFYWSSKDDEKVSDILYIVDGKPYHKPLETLDVNQIESIEVVKDKDIRKYTTEEYDGVLKITTKQQKEQK